MARREDYDWQHPCMATPDHLRRVNEPSDERPPRARGALAKLIALVRHPARS